MCIRRPLQSVERVRLHLLAYNIQSLSNSHPSKQGPEEAISPASPGGQAAGIEESYPPGTQAAGIQDLGARMLESYHLIFFYRGSTRLQQSATGCHRPPNPLAQDPANLPKSVLPPAQECQMAQLGTLPEPVEPKCSHKLAGTIPSDTTGDPRPPKSNPNWSHICHQASKKTSIQASKNPSLGS